MDPDESNDSNANSKQAKNPLKVEWSLFWEALLGDNDQSVAGESPLKALTREQVAQIIKDLSAQRKQLHKQIESVNKEIELNNAKLESLRLVGSEPDDTIQRISQLSDRGQELSSELQKLNQKLKWARAHEKEIGNKDWA
jgi:methyl-accepting chemotaxis protein